MPKAVSTNVYKFLCLLSSGATPATSVRDRFDWTAFRTAGVGRIATRKGWAIFNDGVYTLTREGRILIDSNPKLYTPVGD